MSFNLTRWRARRDRRLAWKFYALIWVVTATALVIQSGVWWHNQQAYALEKQTLTLLEDDLSQLNARIASHQALIDQSAPEGLRISSQQAALEAYWSQTHSPVPTLIHTINHRPQGLWIDRIEFVRSAANKGIEGYGLLMLRVKAQAVSMDEVNALQTTWAEHFDDPIKVRRADLNLKGLVDVVFEVGL